MRERFNTGKYWDRLKAGEFRSGVLDECMPRADVAQQEPLGTLSQKLSYRDGNNDEVARVHQYTRPDGTIGAGGLPDPKLLLEGGMLYGLHKKPKGK
jgi:hypothetical protein